MKYKTSVGLVILSLLASSEALRILVVFPFFSKSHSILGHGVVNRLLAAGHEVFHITAFPKDQPVANLTELNVASIGERFMKNMGDDHSQLKNMIGQDNSFGDSIFFAFFSYYYHKEFLYEPSVVEFLSDPNQKFDAVIIEWFFSELTGGIANLFECPLIWLGSTSGHWQVMRIMDEVSNPAYTPDLFAAHRPPMTFFQRLQGLWSIVKKTVIMELFVLQLERWSYNGIYPEIAAKRGVTMPSYSEVIYNASLLFVNSHPSVGDPMKFPPSVVDIAGYHIDKAKPLPQDLQKLMDEAKDGVIYFSMGSNIKSDGMSDEMKRSLLDMFSKYKETVIWKFESNMTDVPANVHLVEWAPQTSILNHPNLKLFITHGGKLSTIEAIHFGVPVVGMPAMADQLVNMKTVEHKGFGIKVDLTVDVTPALDAAVKKVLSDDSYRKKAKELSAIYHGRTMPPDAAFVHWVEHVVRTRGAPHLRSPALLVPFYQRLYLDLAVFLIIVYYILKRAIKYLLEMWKLYKSKKEKSS